ncbi:MAG: family Rossman fold protein [Caulobacteraceae bacterium]|nr:family Rossman fold protein [Caulobacteraceae bacterium]
MSIPSQSTDLASIDSVCVYCGSSNAADPAWLEAAAALGAALAAEGLRLVYGGGGVGLMGACARAAHAAGGRVLGVMPRFLVNREVVLDEVETVIVTSMHERKIKMFEAADAFVVLPGAIGTLEEAVELLSWRRLGLHAKPIVFYDPGGFWRPLFDLFEKFIADNLVPAEFRSCWDVVERIEDVIPALRAMPAGPTVAPVMRVVA